MGIVERIKNKCKENATNISNLERELGFGNGNIRRWETQKPSYDKILAVANMLNVSLDWLITGKEPGELTVEEQELVDCYRAANDQGKRTILGVAQMQKQEQQSSTSKIG